MPKACAVLVKPKTEKGHAGAGLAVLVPVDVAAAADPACDAAESYKGPDGKPLFTRTIPRRVMENDLRRAETFHYKGNKDGVDGPAEAKKIRTHLAGSFKTGSRPVAEKSVSGDAWSCDAARLAATHQHKAVAEKALGECEDGKLCDAAEYLRIAAETRHEQVSFDAVSLAVSSGATKEQLVAVSENIKFADASLLAYESAMGGKKKGKE